MAGYIKLHRQLIDSDFWLSETFTKPQAWIDLFANANHADGSFWVRGIEIKLSRGQIGWSEITMSRRWKWSREKVRRFLKSLIKNDMIEKYVSLADDLPSITGASKTRQQNLTTIITIKNYNNYQNETAKRQQTRQQKDSKRDINNNDKNDKKILLDDFESFWTLYDKKVKRSQAASAWSKLSDSVRLEVLSKIPDYVAATPDKKFRKDPITYLTNESWNDEIIKSNGTKKSIPEGQKTLQRWN